MDSNEKKEILETVVTYLTGALDEAKDELAVLEKAEAPEPEPPTLHHLDWGIDNKGDFLFFILNDGRFKAWTLYGGYCKDFTVEVTEDYIKDVSIKGNLQSIFEQLAIDDMVSNVAGAIKEMALKSGYVEPDRKFPRQQEDSQGYCPECQAKIIAAKDGEFVPICAKCLIGASREFYLKKVV